MRKLTLFMLAGLMVLAAATVSLGSDKAIGSIDSSGVASVAIAGPVSHLTMASSADRVALDSNGVWLANDFSHGGTAAAAVKGSTSTEKMYCFDSGSEFCAKAAE